MKLSIGIVGAGAVGSALSHAFARAGCPPVAVFSRRHEHAADLASAIPGCVATWSAQDVVAAADLVFLTVPDDAIQDVCDQLVWRSGIAVVHCSGALSSSVLESARRQGAQVGSFHPLQTFSGAVNDADLIPGSTIGIEAGPPLDDVLVDLAVTIGGHPLRLTAESKPLYHAAAVMASNYVVTLMALAADLCSEFGVNRPDAVRALLPLLKGAVTNIERRGLPEALTGPIARGDVETVLRHVRALTVANEPIASVYRALAEPTVAVARERGQAPPDALDAIEELVGHTSRVLAG